ncbi:hypothetical protein COEREDRAFT_11692 [Coemansia reversa NRRL 1564]|uniref:Uncharacterized protein n=1 Tax=Coemansia reversa (strain ATCC 12441 / NRRL 1564) TaxID=763665 RepID=A0A2G5B2H3_COERN|nr:hypothetical protein COEREDRAFT_11692 [Coemansia reversa NRRL 1564]|eukprot:PIA13195.1 hypothetical protein COEREDRAFT_11692 [Coemansia reversa NRRL 1564]
MGTPHTGELENLKASGSQSADVIMPERGPVGAQAPLMKASNLMEYLQRLIPEYSGDAATELILADTWTHNLEKICTRLTGVAADEMCDAGCDTPEAMLQQLRDRFQALQFQYELILRIESGTVFKQCTRLNILNRLQKLAGELANHIGGLVALAQATQKMFGMEWNLLRINPRNLIAKVKDTGSSKIREKTGGSPSKKASEETQNKKRRVARNKRFKDLEEEVKSLRRKMADASVKKSSDTKPNEVSVGKQAVEAVADPGAEVSVITLKMAQRLGLKVDRSRRPWLKPIWSGTNYKAFGRAKSLVDIADVVDDEQKWELLLGNPDLGCLDVQLQTLAMHRRMRKKAQVEPKVVSTPQALTDDDYAEITVPERAEDF